jgi:hypothetical protein
MSSRSLTRHLRAIALCVKPMRARARPILLARNRITAVAEALHAQRPSEWAPHLRLAYLILQKEIGLSSEQSVRVISESVAAAHTCARQISGRSMEIVRANTHIQIKGALLRIAKCSKRAPARVRHELAEALEPLLGLDVTDLETIDAIFDTAGEIFGNHVQTEAAKTALATLRVRIEDGRRIAGLKSAYSAIHPSVHERIVLALSGLQPKCSASDVFEVMALAIPDQPNQKKQINDLIVEYVVAVIAIWGSAGLRAGRAHSGERPDYRGKFHRFVDLVLTAVVEPYSGRHQNDRAQTARQVWKAHSQLPKALRPKISRSLRRADVEWLVNDGHLKDALRTLKK